MTSVVGDHSELGLGETTIRRNERGSVMKRIRRAIVATIAAAMLRPVRRWLTARLRREATQYAEATIAARAQELWSTTGLGSLAVPETDTPMTPDDTAEDRDRRDVVRTTLIAGAVVVLMASLAIAIVAVARSRRRARHTQAAEATIVRVGVPVDMPPIEDGDRDLAHTADEAVPAEAAVVAGPGPSEDAEA